MNTTTNTNSLWSKLFGSDSATPTVGVSVSFDTESLSQLAGTLLAVGILLIILNRFAHRLIKS